MIARCGLATRLPDARPRAELLALLARSDLDVVSEVGVSVPRRAVLVADHSTDGKTILC
jgi:hypothetical protein